jgi:hypothetical protein
LGRPSVGAGFLESESGKYMAFEIPDKSSIASPTAINDKNVVVDYSE